MFSSSFFFWKRVNPLIIHELFNALIAIAEAAEFFNIVEGEYLMATEIVFPKREDDFTWVGKVFLLFRPILERYDNGLTDHW